MSTVITTQSGKITPPLKSYPAARPDWLKAELYPFESRYLDIEGNRIHYVDEGNGPVLLFLHAGPAWSFIYRNFIKTLRGRFRCIAPDYPGFGLSTGAADYGYTLLEHAHVIEQFILALDLKKITLMVHDSSGSIGLGVAGKLADRFKGLIITDTFAWPLSDYPKVVKMLKFVTGPVFGFLNNTFNIIPWTVVALAPGGRKLSQAEKRVFLKAFSSRAARQRVLTLFKDLYTQEDYMRQVEQGLKDRLSHLPALLMYGENDPARQQGWQSRFEGVFPNHQSLVIKDEGHFPHEGAPDEMIAAINSWWDSESTKGLLK